MQPVDEAVPQGRPAPSEPVIPQAVPAPSSELLGGALALAAARYADAHGVLPGPEPVRTRVRWRVSPRAALAAAAATALVAGGVALRAAATRPGEVVELPVPLPVVTTSVPGPVTTSAAEVVVDVAGAVVRPGVVRLPAGSRVVDALAAAGGASADADLTRLNLARVLVDAEQVLVAREGDPAVPGGAVGAPAAVDPALVDLNSADVATLETLPGIGPVLAERIVERRQAQPFTSVDELLDVPGIGPAVLDKLRDEVRV